MVCDLLTDRSALVRRDAADALRSLGTQSGSKTIRDKHWDWFCSTAYSRLEPGAVVVIVMTRWHEDDLIGRLLAEQGQGK